VIEGTCAVAAPALDTAWSFVHGLNSAAFAGHDDWRLPTRAELQSLVAYLGAATSPAIDAAFRTPLCGTCPDVNDPGCSCSAPDRHWSAATYVPVPLNAWSVSFVDGAIGPLDKTGTASVRAVRGGS
jgi:hypothetical protein